MHQQPKLPLLSLNHVSFVCKSVAESVRFYERVLGFVLVKRPSPSTSKAPGCSTMEFASICLKWRMFLQRNGR
ncbi:hypothetical protein EUGRSUZ_L02833 [Eucalyptus grandis]|uniref:Glyoxalase/fosfomycin resistance/dioxygenase domain-containing protein n=1 Tax=Eucalyptus grandis TaxID=71139 RepID=A0AAD9T9D6_EUCGR|nr:hypothetical protein EUGRSUZ_L02833 [Eucalyptus grandis]